MLPANLELRAVFGADTLSYSELATLARCEQAWVLGYTGVRERSAPSAAMALGSELHRLWGALWLTGEIPSTENETAAAVMDRYARHYAGSTLRCVGVEVPAAARLSWGPWLIGFVDGIFEVTGVAGVPDGLYVGECKSADKLSSATHLVQSPQTPMYVWTLRQMGLPIVGSFIDILRTSNAGPRIETKGDCYKRLRQEMRDQGRKESAAETQARVEENRQVLGEAPLEESFDRRWLLEADLDIPRALGQARRASGVRRQLLDGEPALRAIGPSCSWCFCQAACFQLDVELEDESDAEQPF